MTPRRSRDDRELFGQLRSMWAVADPPPDELATRMVAAVAAADLSDEYALLTLVENAPTAAVRGENDRLTLQFVHGPTTLLLHVTDDSAGTRRIDGYIDGPASDIELVSQTSRAHTTPDRGRFFFAGVEPGIVRVRVTLSEPIEDGDPVMMTPRFEL